MTPESERKPLVRDAHFEQKRSEKRSFLSQYVVKGGVGAELGVFWGHFSEVIIREFQPRTLYLVDLWDLQGEAFHIEGAFSDFGRLRTADCYAHVKQIEAQYPDIVRVVKADASQFLATHRGEPFDWVYVDTSHLYEPTLNELMLAAERLKPEGVILGDDWIADPSHAHYEVVQAVHSFVRGTEFEIVVAGRGHQFVLRRGMPRRRVAAAAPTVRPTRDATQQRLRRLASQKSLSIDILNVGASTKFPPSLSASLTHALKPQGIVATVRDLSAAPTTSAADVVMVIAHSFREEATYLNELRNGGYDGIIAAWLWDNHHAKKRNRQVVELTDVTTAAHDCHAAYLAGDSLLLHSVPVCSAQWTPEEARTLWDSIDPATPRSRELYGGFGRYKGSERTPRLEQMLATGRYPGLYFVDGVGRFEYYAMSRDDRFRHWAGHAVSLCLPYRNDLGLRFFDAWLTGQIPVVTPDIPELQSAWATPHRDRHFVEAASSDPADIDAAHARALALFDAGGREGQQFRHQLVLDQHLMQHRIDRIAALLREAGSRGIDAVLHTSAR